VGLGSQTPGGIPTSAWNGDRYLEITVGGETLNPRELIRSVPIAGMALTVPDGAIGTAQIADGAVSTTDLAINAITSGQIADNAFSTSRIADGAVTQAKAPYLAAAPWNNRLVVVTTWVGHTNSSGIATVDISSYGFSGIDSVVVSNGDDYAVARGVFNVYDWNTAQVQVRCWNINGTLLANTLLRVNLAIMGTH